MANDKTDKLLRRINKDLEYSSIKSSKLHKDMENDAEFAQGKQWDEDAISTLDNRGVKALTINKVKPIIRLLTGIERQSKSDFKVLPEGKEDGIIADIYNRLVKNVSKNSRVQDKLSESFKDGVTSGMSMIEPYIDYTFDLINGDLKFKKISGQNVFLDPDFKEYDLSDARYLVKLTRDLTKEDLIALFPDKEKDIDKISNGKIELNSITNGSSDMKHQVKEYSVKDGYTNLEQDNTEARYDLIDYYYKDFQKRYYVYIESKEISKEFRTKEEAELFAKQFADFNPNLLERKVNVIMLAQSCGDLLLFNDVAPTYPRWKTYPLIPFFAELSTDSVDKLELKIQGIVRGIKDLNIEYNKRRTQELNILNTSQNSGFWIQKGSMDQEDEEFLRSHGSAPGFIGKYKRGYDAPTRIQPMQLSQGHAQLAAENAQDLKEASGVNPDLLANDSQSQSGRAILLKQRQGLVMLQEILDNYEITKNQLGKYIVSQLSEIMTVTSAKRILGSDFLAENFSTPINIILERGLAKVSAGQQPTELEQEILLQYPQTNPDEPILDERGQLITVTDTDTADLVIQKVLNDAEMGKYDIAVGEGAYQDTIAMANFMDLKELAQQGIPIPPQDLITESQLPDASKKRMIQNLIAMQQAAQMQPAKQANEGA